MSGLRIEQELVDLLRAAAKENGVAFAQEVRRRLWASFNYDSREHWHETTVIEKAWTDANRSL